VKMGVLYGESFSWEEWCVGCCVRRLGCAFLGDGVVGGFFFGIVWGGGAEGGVCVCVGLGV